MLCGASGWVLRRYDGLRVIVLVDETKLGKHLSVMMVGLAYRRCCVPLVWWAYRPDEWPLGQGQLISRLLGWVAAALPPGVVRSGKRTEALAPRLRWCVWSSAWLALATAWTLTLGAFVFDECDLKRYFTKGHLQTCAIFRLGLRLSEAILDHTAPLQFSLEPLIGLSLPHLYPLSVGA